MGRKTTERPYYATALQALRESRLLTPKQLSEKAGVPHETVRYLEKGTRTPSYKVLLRLAEFFGISPREFFAP